jgi:hypothetical protein
MRIEHRPELTFGEIYMGPNSQAHIRYAAAFKWQPRAASESSDAAPPPPPQVSP